MHKKIYIHAVNIHEGGGAKLLEGIFQAINNRHGNPERYIFSLDARMLIAYTPWPNSHVKWVKGTILSRLTAELNLFRSVSKGDYVLCFGNLPPLFRLKGFVCTFIQNRYLVDETIPRGLKLRARLRIFCERLWVSLCWRHVDLFLVQTSSMQYLLRRLTRGNVPINVTPFAALAEFPSVPRQFLGGDTSVHCFVYVASGEGHKNHPVLIEAWRLLAEEGINPKLIVTLDSEKFPELCSCIDEQVMRHQLRIQNIGKVGGELLRQLYSTSTALIYPSKFESFGLPLIEAQHMGVPIIAPELDYVRDVVVPKETFDPESAISIARAVKRFCGISTPPPSVMDPDAFIAAVLARAG